MPSIAIIEDESTAAESLASLLSIRGFDSEVFESSEAFLNVDKPESFKFLIVDHHLGGGRSGSELLEYLRENGIDTPAILLNENFEGDQLADADGNAVPNEQISNVTHVTKPCPPMLMLQTIDEAITPPPTKQAHE